MSFLSNLFNREEKTESVVLIDIGASSIAGAYARYSEGELPAVLYTRRLPIEIRTDEPLEQAMLRALQVLGNDLIREGAPVLARATGSGSVSKIIVAIDAPWQETTVRTENFEAEEPFVFTKSLVAKRLAETNVTPSDKLFADASIIGTILNGYETRTPYERKVHRASMVVLTSLIERKVADAIIAALRSLFHITTILPIAGNSLRYQTMREVFPHERDALILDATDGSLISVALVRKGIFVTMVQIPTPTDMQEWISTVTVELTEISKHFPLPRTIFLLAHEPEIFTLREMLDTANFGSLWLSDNPPKIVSVLKSQLSGLVQQKTTNPADIVLLLMALFFQNTYHLKETLNETV